MCAPTKRLKTFILKFLWQEYLKLELINSIKYRAENLVS